MSVTDYGTVAVLMGGWSAEREVSLASGRTVLEALRRAGVDAHGVDVDRDIARVLDGGRYDRAFVILHGRGGEDGCVQGLLEILRLPYTGSGVEASAVCMNKRTTKRLWQAAGLPTPPFMEVDGGTDPAEVERRLGWPVMVKPALEGSSIGMSRADDADSFREAVAVAEAAAGPVLAERWVTGPEYTAAVLEGHRLPLIAVETDRPFYDYEAKYLADDTRYRIPCGLEAPQEAELQALAQRAFAVTGASGWGRVDLILDQQGRPWLIEVNTVPGMTDHSLVPKAAAAAGLGLEALVLAILDTAGLDKW